MNQSQTLMRNPLLLGPQLALPVGFLEEILCVRPRPQLALLVGFLEEILCVGARVCFGAYVGMCFVNVEEVDFCEFIGFS